MAHYRLFADFGSTFTKLAAFDMEAEVLAARTQAPSTVDTDILLGLREAFGKMQDEIPVTEKELQAALACSSAAGGLKMVCVGLVPDYTTEAGRLAALGAGAKVVGTYSYELSRAEIGEIAAKKPDILLLTGGTDGGNQKVILHNAERIASRPDCAGHVIVAGNVRANETIREIFAGTDMDVQFAPNVMPTLGDLSLDPVNARIREVFLSRIVEAKGIASANRVISQVRMPTPSAVFQAAKLLSAGPDGKGGMGELVLVDVGGATTDVYSLADGLPSRDGVEPVGLREPYAKRTVEGDLGLYHNLDVLVGLAEQDRILSEEDGMRAASALKKSLSVPDAQSVDSQLMFSRLAVETAVDRHAGRLVTHLSPHGLAMRQKGKDLTEVKVVIGAGGPVSFSSDPHRVLSGAVSDPAHPAVLKPADPRLYIDSRYILFAVGLLAEEDPAAAFRIAKKYLAEVMPRESGGSPRSLPQRPEEPGDPGRIG